MARTARIGVVDARPSVILGMSAILGAAPDLAVTAWGPTVDSPAEHRLLTMRHGRRDAELRGELLARQRPVPSDDGARCCPRIRADGRWE